VGKERRQSTNQFANWGRHGSDLSRRAAAARRGLVAGALALAALCRLCPASALATPYYDRRSALQFGAASGLAAASPPAAALQRKRVQYGAGPDQFAELWCPTGAAVGEGWPVIALIHGGFWSQAYGCDLMDGLAAFVSAQGIACYNVEYRRIGWGGAGENRRHLSMWRAPWTGLVARERSMGSILGAWQ
jgi:acetyl esterase/lipase